MTEIKSRISFNELNAVVKKVINETFVNDTYSPTYYDLSLRTALISAYAPEFKLNDNDDNSLYESVYTEEACEIINEIKRHKQYYDIESAIRNGVNFRKDMITSGGMSMSDLALAGLMDKIAEVVEKLGNNIDADSTKKFVEKVTSTQGNLTAKDMVKALADTGLLGKSE